MENMKVGHINYSMDSVRQHGNVRNENERKNMKRDLKETTADILRHLYSGPKMCRHTK